MGSLYHEKQVSMLCGVHALNSLLQGPYFTAHDLGAIAQEFDAKEKALMREAGVDSADFLRYMAEDSGNAAADGNFSIQVLTKALEVWGLTCIPAMSQAAGSAWREPQGEAAFLCNLDQHWFTVRRCDRGAATASPTVHAAGGACWWNFNSMFPAPQPISELYLGEFLAQLREEGYSIFVVRGSLPPVGANGMAGRTGEYGGWCTAEEAAAANKQADAVKAAGRARNASEQAMARIGVGGTSTLQLQPSGPGGGGGGGGMGGMGEGGDDAELQAAIAASLGHAGGGGGGGGMGGVGMGMGMGGAGGAGGSGDDDDLARALAASLAGAAPPGGGGGGGAVAGVGAGGGGAPAGVGGGGDADADLAAAIAASLAESSGGGGGGGGHETAVATVPIPEEPGPGEPGSVMLAIRIPSGSRLQRLFRDDDTVGGVAAFVAAAAGMDMSRHVLTTSFPRKQLRELGATLKESGVKDKEALSVEPTNTR